MAEEKAQFRFLTSEEFNKLTQSEKMDYITRAMAALKATGTGRDGLFADPEPKPKSD